MRFFAEKYKQADIYICHQDLFIVTERFCFCFVLEWKCLPRLFQLFNACHCLCPVAVFLISSMFLSVYFVCV